MAEVVFDDILGQIFVRLDVKDIIRCKSVCKSWCSFISSSGFVNFHLKHNNTDTIGHRRILIDGYWKNNLVGSSNGLVCIFTSDRKLCVHNPCTRELKSLENRDFGFGYDRSSDDPYLCGFGHDPSSDDYKVIVGKHQESLTRFYLLSLRSNVWKVVGDLDFDLGIVSAGILCNGALHWLIRDQNHNTAILCFHLSKEKFEEIPTPANDRCEYTCHTRLGITIKESLCIFDDKKRGHPIWVMKHYKDIHSWELLPHLLKWDEDIAHDVKVLKLKSYYRAKTFFYYDRCRLSTTQTYISAPVYVQSLVSPHVNKRRKRKRKVMLIKGEWEMLQFPYRGRDRI